MIDLAKWDCVSTKVIVNMIPENGSHKIDFIFLSNEHIVISRLKITCNLEGLH